MRKCVRIMVISILVLWLIIDGLVLANHSAKTIVINEVMSSNSLSIIDQDQDASDWIELYNTSDNKVSLNGYFLSDKANDLLKWSFPEGINIEPHGFLIVWASGKDIVSNHGELHTNFSISKSGEELFLTYRNNIIDHLTVVKLERNFSYGRKIDGEDTLVKFALAATTPGKTNDKAPAYTPAVTELNPHFSHVEGFYTEAFDLILTAPQSTTIYYTLDGSVPDPILNSKRTQRYSKPISIAMEFTPVGRTKNITSGVFPEPPLTYLQTSYTKWFRPTTQQFKGTVIRARAYDVNGNPSEMISKTYFVDPNGFRHTLPVIAITVDPLDLYDYERGIYIPGIGFHQNLPWAYHYWGSGNFHGRGSIWERPAYIEFWETDNTLAFAQNIGIRIHGDASRSHAQKSLRLIASDEYDAQDTFKHEVFPGRTTPFTNEPYDEFKTLILRNGGNTWENTMFKDGLLHNLIQHTEVAMQYFRPAIVYLNGEYWGIHNIRDRYDEWYFHYTYGVEPNSVEIIEDSVLINDGSVPQDDLSREHYRQILRLIHPDYATVGYPTVSTLTNPDIYDQVKQLMDIDNFFQYLAIQIYIQNFDWPGNNNRLWRTILPENDLEAAFGHDGLWRWIIVDLDLAFQDVYGNTLANATRTGGMEWQSQPWATFLLRSLFQNPDFRNGFINASADLMNSIFLPEVVIAEIDHLTAIFRPEIEEHMRRWNKPATSLSQWNWQVEMLKGFARQRPGINRGHMISYFELSGTTDIILKTDTNKGMIKINSLEITSSTPGVKDANQWSGKYFRGVPITLEAKAKDGYSFAGWSGVPSELQYEPVITITPNTAAMTVTAMFI